MSWKNSDKGGYSGRGSGSGGSGRGAYYKNKYGGGRGRGQGQGRGRGRGRYNDNNNNNRRSFSSTDNGGGSYSDLQDCLRRIDGQNYGAYHQLDTATHSNRVGAAGGGGNGGGGGWFHEQLGFTLYVERAQSDPFAPPTRCRIVVHNDNNNANDGIAATATATAYPPSLYSNPIRRMALTDFMLRKFHKQCQHLGADTALRNNNNNNNNDNGGWNSPKGGNIQILEPGQNVLEQSAIQIDEVTGTIIAQLTIHLPARGRTILGTAAEHIFLSVLPKMVQYGLFYNEMDTTHLALHVDQIEDQCWVQSQLDKRGLVAFVMDGAILPRLSGAEDRPMPKDKAIPFVSPEKYKVRLSLPNAKIVISGMGIPKGITLICGGGFHGKSTLLEALQLGIYPKISGDGREFCMTSPRAFKIRAEDGRNVQAVDISMFINNLPFTKDTTSFYTSDASGSTSQAANIMEAMEVGADTLLIDEDTCASNFMNRDDKMTQLVAPEKEPITPFVRTVRFLYSEKGASTVMVVGGVGDFFDVADNVLVMDCYHCRDATEEAKRIASTSNSSSFKEALVTMNDNFQRVRSVVRPAFSVGKVKVFSKTKVGYGDIELDISGLEQLAAKAQTTAIANALQMLADMHSTTTNSTTDTLPLLDILSILEAKMDKEGLDCLVPAGQFHGGMARPRVFEIAGAINRLRKENSIVQGKTDINESCDT